MKLNIKLKFKAPLMELIDQEDLVAVNRSMGDGIRDLLKVHFVQRAQSVGSRKYWGQAAEATQSTHTPSGASVEVKHLGVRLHWYGGTVKPIAPRKRLLIPGKKSPLYLKGVSLAQSGIPDKEIVAIKKKATGTLFLAWVKDGQMSPLGILAEQSVHQPDPSVLPDRTALKSTAKDAAVSSLAKTLKNKQS